MNVIEARELSMRYGDMLALDSVSLEVPEKSIFAILGPNGAGKTTLFDLLVNLRTPTGGEALVLNADSRTLDRRAFESIGYVSDDQQLPDWMTVSYFLDYLRPFYASWDETRARQLIEQFQVPPERKLRNLSRGMRMKTMLASSMAYRPRLLILDEPFSGLDPLTREELIEALLECAEEATVLLSSHDLPEIETFVTHIAYLADGRLQFAESLARLTERFRQVSVTLEIPGRSVSLPGHWIAAEISPNTVRFVDPNFDPVGTEAAARSHFGGIRRIDTEAMSLRSIFLALARLRKADRGGES